MGSHVRGYKNSYVHDNIVKNEDLSYGSLIVRVVNVGAIFMASNITSLSHTKCIDIAEYDSDVLTKSSSAELHENCLKKMIDKKLK